MSGGESWEENRLLIEDRFDRIERQLERIIAFGWKFFWLAIGGIITLVTHVINAWHWNVGP